MDLYAFGFNGNSQLHIPSPSSPEDPPSKDNILVPTKITSAKDVYIHWASWCDAIIQKFDPSTLHYTGSSLTPSQVTTGIHGHDSKLLSPSNPQLGYPSLAFGNPLGTGLQGFVRSHVIDSDTPMEETSIWFFNPDTAQEKGFPEIERFYERHAKMMTDKASQLREDMRIQHIAIASSGRVAIIVSKSGVCTDSALKDDISDDVSAGRILEFDSMAKFKTWVAEGRVPDSDGSEPRVQPIAHDHIPPQKYKQLLAGATTFTALTYDGQVYTWSQDRRYSACLGRDSHSNSTPASQPHPIPYLSETLITKIASGGYMTAALSSDNELFLWGQACPGTNGELEYLKQKPYSGTLDGDLFIHDPGTDIFTPPPPAHMRPWSYSNAKKWAREVAEMRQDGRLYNPYRKVYSQESAVEDEDEDQYVKCVKIEIEEREARVTDVATGSGHILVVAEVEAMAKVERAVFAAGQGESGQLGVGGTPKFVDEFTEVRELRGKKVRSLVCAGWSSWVVVESEAG